MLLSKLAVVETVLVDEMILTASIDNVKPGCVLVKSIDLYHFAF